MLNSVQEFIEVEAWLLLTFLIPAGIYLLKVNNRNNRTMCEIYSKLTITIPKRRHWRRSGAFIVHFEHIFTPCSSVSILNFEHVISGWYMFRQLSSTHSIVTY